MNPDYIKEGLPISFDDYLATCDSPLGMNDLSYCGFVCSKTAAKWCDVGGLKHFRIGKSRTRRVLVKDFYAFLLQHNIPTDRLERHMKKEMNR